MSAEERRVSERRISDVDLQFRDARSAWTQAHRDTDAWAGGEALWDGLSAVRREISYARHDDREGRQELLALRGQLHGHDDRDLGDIGRLQAAVEAIPAATAAAIANAVGPWKAVALWMVGIFGSVLAGSLLALVTGTIRIAH